MKRETKTGQLQIRVTRQQKAFIRRAAKEAGMGISSWVLAKAISRPQGQFQDLLKELAAGAASSAVLAELNDFLTQLSAPEFVEATNQPPRVELSRYLKNYVCAMIDYGANLKGTQAPSWIEEVPPLEAPVFGTELRSLRLHLLTSSPIPFRCRNIFIDSTIGHRV